MAAPFDPSPAAAELPPPVTLVNAEGRSDIVLICEHASPVIPPEFAGLGLPPAERERHIAWDIGAAHLTRGLARSLDAPAFLAGYSRLLIDLNRPLGVPSSIPELSEATPVPGNAGLSDADRQARAERFFAPFHDRVAEFVTAREAAGRRTVIVAVHSFTPVFLGQARPWHAGILFDRSAALAGTILEALGRDPAITAAANEPYVISPSQDHTILAHGQDRGHEAVLIEIRQDLLQDAAGIAEWTERLAGALHLAAAAVA
ncbi:N-formylglutamate amidohydrolase [Poseidonocella sp. HB161398]|uniref:N-formylglutamate amidohydrolase n=1 Tax=Poseidonocella sp. HB161398 TaxID=2320855 RepID=UPI0011098EA3|nr:N-formylglutamate amidohydrolase [Poseidonocella sp. HB161398]